VNAPPTLSTWRQRWRSLPRDARDTLFLLMVIAWTVIPHGPNLPAWCLLFAAAVLVWRARLAWVNGPLPGRAWLLLAMGAAAALTAWTHGTLLGRDAGITMAVVLMTLKTLELRARRDAFVVFFLGFFLVLTHFFFSQSLITALAMVVSVWGLLAALALAHMPAGRPPLREALGQAAHAALLGAPIMALLFVFFPRVGPLWGTPSEMRARTGLSGSMALGGMAELAQDDTVAMRVRFLTRDGLPPAPDTLYFRGPVLDHFDGREWRSSQRARTPAQPADLAPLLQARQALPYELTVEPLRVTTLPLLEFTPEAPAIDNDPGNLELSVRADLVWTAQRPLGERLRLQATAYPTRGTVRAAEVRLPLDQLQLPANHNPRLLQWARELRQQPELLQADARGLAQAVMQHIRREPFSYTLAPGTYGDKQPLGLLDEFWFDRREGFCEHYSAAFVVALRAMGVPARVVTGYQGVEPVPVDGYYLVRQSHAHAWAEYWQDGRGWTRADPTSAVAPERISASRPLLPPRNVLVSTLDGMSPDLLTHLRSLREFLDNRWNQWVLNYSRGQQLNLLQRLGFSSPSWRDLVMLLMISGSLLALAGAWWAAWDRRRQDPWARQLQRVRDAVAALQVQAPPHATARAMAQALSARYGDKAQSVTDWLLTLEQRRYGPSAERRPSEIWWYEFKRRSASLRPDGVA
jgi:protein-glutamine gamma-glutamyltransferase